MSRKNRSQTPRIAQPPALLRPESVTRADGTSASPISAQSPQQQISQRLTAPLTQPPSSTSPPTLEQQRAASALKSVRAVENESFGTEYRSYVESLPATIVMNGLGQACATMLASANGDGERAKAYRQLHDHLQSWLCRPPTGSDTGGVYRAASSLIDAITLNGQSQYIHAQAESLAFLVWLKKFAQAFLPRRS